MSERTIGNNRLIDGEKLDNLPDDVESELDLKQDILAEGAFVDGDKTNLDNQSGTNTGDQTDVTGNAGTVTTINGKLSNGTNVTISGTGTDADPYVISASGSGGDLGDLTDVTIATPITGQVIAYNDTTGEWENTTIAGSGDVSSTDNITDNSILRGDGGSKNIQESEIKIDDTGNILPNTDDAQNLGSEDYTFSNGYFKTENGTLVTIRQLAGLQRDYSEESAILPFTISQSVTSSTWTYTITDDSGAGYIAVTLDDKVIRSTGTTLSVDLTSYAGTDANPNLIYIYIQNNGSDVPELVASNTNPEGVTTHVQVAVYEAGAVSTDSVTIYGKADTVLEMYKIAKNVYVRAFNDGPIYNSGLDITATSTDVTIGVGNYKLIFDDITTASKQVSVDGFYYIANDGTYNEITDFSFGGEYSDGVTISNNKYFNIVLGVLEDDTTRIVGVVQSGTSEEYTSFSGAYEDASNQTVYYPDNSFLNKIFVPVCRLIAVRTVGDVYTLQQFDNGNYYEDLRGYRGASGGSGGGSSNVEDGNIENDFVTRNATNGQYEPQTIAETKTILSLSDYATLTGTETLTNKTIDGDSNTISNLDIGNEVDWANSTDVTDASDFATGDKMLIYEAGVGLRKIDYDDLPSGSSGSVTLPLTHLAFYGGSITATFIRGFIEKDDGYVYIGGGQDSGYIQRYIKQAGQLILNNSDTTAIDYYIDTTQVISGMAQIDSSNDYIYYTTSTADTMYRLDVSAGTSTLMTISGITFVASSGIISDGTYLYILEPGTTNCYKLSVSGTTATYVSTITLPVSYYLFTGTCPLWYGNNFYYMSSNNSIVKCSDSGVLDYQLYTTTRQSAKGYGAAHMFFEFNNYIMLGYMQYDSEDITGVGLQIIEDLN